MPIEQEDFRKYNEEKKVDSVSVRLNTKERLQLEEDKKLIQQTKDSTAIKTIYNIGSIVIHDKKTMAIIEVLFKNKRNNERLGIAEFD